MSNAKEFKAWFRKHTGHSTQLKAAHSAIIELEDKLKWAYCKEKGADSILGLDICDDYRDWLKSLSA
jgi:hypothetical protein